MESSRASPEVRRLTECIEEMRETVQSSGFAVYPNTVQHQQIWNGVGEIVKTAFVPEIDDDEIKAVMGLGVDTYLKILLLLGVGVFSMKPDNSYVELIKKMAYNQKLLVVIATSDYIYGTNYNFCHGFLGKDLLNMTRRKLSSLSVASGEAISSRLTRLDSRCGYNPQVVLDRRNKR
jgi:hypothetical protein